MATTPRSASRPKPKPAAQAPAQAGEALAAGQPSGAARPGARGPSRRHPGSGPDRDRHLPRRRRLRCTGPAARSATAPSAPPASCSARSATPSRPPWSLPVALILMRELRPPARPMRTGAAVPGGGADPGAGRPGRSGSAPGRPRPPVLARRPASSAAAGWSARPSCGRPRTCFSTVGADILAVFLFIAGLILVSGATLAGIAAVHRRRRARAPAGRCGARPRICAATRGAPPGNRSRSGTPTAPTGWPIAGEPLLPPEPDTAELVVRATHVEAPPIESPADEEPAARRRRRDLGRPERGRGRARARPRPSTTRRRPGADVSAEDLTPQGRYRASITDDPDFEWRVPVRAF